MRSRILYILVLALAFSQGAGANNDEYRFTQLTTFNSGLSYDGISKIFQDSRGYIWIGTFSGLDRYDGTRFRTFGKADLGLSSDFVHTIIEDREGNLWIGTDKGVSRYIWATDRFEPFLQESDQGTIVRNKVTFLYCGHDGRVWIISNYQGVFCYDASDGTLKNYRDVKKKAPEYNTDEMSISFRRMAEDGQGGFWVSKYHQNLFHADSLFRHVTIVPIPQMPDYFTQDDVEQIFPLDGTDGELLIASIRHGLSRYNPSSQKVENLFSLPEGTTLVDATFCEGRWVWLATTKGAWRYDLTGETPPLNLEEQSYVFSILVDRDGGLWMGTKDGGIRYSGLSHRMIDRIDSYAGGTLRGAVVSGFAQDEKGRVWITTESRGLFCYNPQTRFISPVHAAGGGTIPAKLCSPCYDGRKLWLGSLDGLYCLDTNTLGLRRYGVLKRASGNSDPRVYVTFRSREGDMYFANTLGLFRLRQGGNAIEQIPIFDGVFVTSIAQTPDGLLWISSYATGLFVWNPLTGEMEATYRQGDGSGLPSDKISSVLVDEDGDTWVIGFSCGFARLEEDGRWKVFDSGTHPSLSTDVFFCAVQDAENNLWLTSDRGLFRFNPATESLSRYTVFDGLLEDKLTRSEILLSGGQLLVGSDNGFVSMDPAAFRPTLQDPPLLISRMSVGKKDLSGNIELMDKVTLAADQNSFGFDFSLMTFSSPSSIQLRCRLAGLEKDWQDVSALRNVYYYNVPAGTYNLMVETSAGGGVWTSAHTPLTITVRPTFFNSALGILISFLGIVLLLVVAIYVALRRQRKRREEEIFHDKLNFFSHVVHEIKTPLTLIKTPLQSVMAKEGFDEETRQDLQVVRSNADYLSLLVNELLEFVRIERSGYVLNRENLDLVETIRSLVFNYSDTAVGRNIRLDVQTTMPHVWVWADAPALGKILNNLLINALDYAETFIQLRIDTLPDATVCVKVTNDGPPIPVEFRQDIFKPFVQHHTDGRSLHKGVGIGLPLARLLARKHAGDLSLDTASDYTTFVLTLPLADIVDMPVDESPEQSLEEQERPIVLLVDDNPDFRSFLGRKLEVEYQLIQAANASMAMRVMKERNVELLITDITMPGMDGLELCRRVRADMEISHLAIIVLSARSSVESKIQAMEAGADLYLEKPFDLEYLRSSIHGLLDRRKLMREALSSGAAETDITLFGLPRRDEEFFQAFDNYIKENIGNPDLSNESLSEALCMSQSTLIRKIRKLLNTSPSNYIRTRRLGIAAKMLKDSHGNNITDICYAVGFSNESYFAKCFKEQYGVTPSEYVK